MKLKKCLLWAMIGLLSGCAMSPPEPLQPKGAFRPVNAGLCDTLAETEPVMSDQEVQP